ncbi:hypothetical protein R1sor_026138 [Riccia sorocarpa]|uniref:Uncharacterized protein n=1 Tax=Riccia sorocarpa TaxID=122646 RepID=A0ABD3GDL9_9MARC
MARDGPQAGVPYHFELYTEENEDNYMRWKCISKKEAHRVLRGIDAALLQRSGLHTALWLDSSRPEEGEGPDRLQIVRHYEDLSEWVLERSKTTKTWYANDVFFPEWRPIIQLINVVLPGKQKPLEVTGAFIYILKNKVGPANLNEDLDCVTYFKEKIRKEIRACRKQMMAAGKRKIRPTCIGIVILHILRVVGVVGDEQLVHSDSDEGMPEQQQSESPDRHTQSSSPAPRSGSPLRAVASSSGTSPESPDRREDISQADRGAVASEVHELKQDRERLEKDIKVLEHVNSSEFV